MFISDGEIHKRLHPTSQQGSHIIQKLLLCLARQKSELLCGLLVQRSTHDSRNLRSQHNNNKVQEFGGGGSPYYSLSRTERLWPGENAGVLSSDCVQRSVLATPLL